MLTILAALVLAYLIGSIPFAVVVSRAMGLQDPRSFGSGNPGATNVLRSGSKLAALLTLIGDAAKGWIVVVLARHFGDQAGLETAHIAAVALAVFLGHVFSIFLRFKGGKGVATAAGVLLGIHWALGCSVLVLWIATAAISRYSSLAAIVAAVAAPILAHLFGLGGAWTVAVALMSAVLIWRHQDNIRRLLAGTEGRLGKKKPS
ncbi:glycerol-3-phosphate 1-O-acyltransferase PlsY [Uliginosibacterium sp. H1]|uniref:glycerol-3-phosphate 1-O-acyltransferase PlsY n=1 Tax=Uliginosibacterium sp. H1 TaxID=3114757 RepID=UPI002E1737C0|nr:glycerol-3-phosphate 1-O-acyltransferase PlsY [Uliginosibacterium sp. H1]